VSLAIETIQFKPLPSIEEARIKDLKIHYLAYTDAANREFNKGNKEGARLFAERAIEIEDQVTNPPGSLQTVKILNQ